MMAQVLGVLLPRVGDSDGAPGLALAVAGIWRLNQRVKDLSHGVSFLSVCLSDK